MTVAGYLPKKVDCKTFYSAGDSNVADVLTVVAEVGAGSLDHVAGWDVITIATHVDVLSAGACVPPVPDHLCNAFKDCLYWTKAKVAAQCDIRTCSQQVKTGTKAKKIKEQAKKDQGINGKHQRIFLAFDSTFVLCEWALRVQLSDFFLLIFVTTQCKH